MIFAKSCEGCSKWGFPLNDLLRFSFFSVTFWYESGAPCIGACQLKCCSSVIQIKTCEGCWKWRSPLKHFLKVFFGVFLVVTEIGMSCFVAGDARLDLNLQNWIRASRGELEPKVCISCFMAEVWVSNNERLRLSWRDRWFRIRLFPGRPHSRMCDQYTT